MHPLRTLFRTLLPLAGAALLAGCRPNPSVRLSGETVYATKAATGYTILATDGASTVIEVRNPWQQEGDAATQLFVARNGECPPEGFAGQVVQAPIQSAVCFSATHVAYLDALGCTEIIRGVSGAEYLSNEPVREAFAAGRVRDIGYDVNLNYELLAALQPNVVFIYGVGGEAKWFYIFCVPAAAGLAPARRPFHLQTYLFFPRMETFLPPKSVHEALNAA